MLGLNKATEFNKKIPKNKFYKHIKLTNKLIEKFTNQIESIYWTNKLSQASLNIDVGKEVSEIEVFLIKTKGNDLDENILRTIDKAIPYHILFVIDKKNSYEMAIAYKKKIKGLRSYFDVDKYFYKKIKSLEEKLVLEGHDMDQIYENLLRNIGNLADNKRPIGESIARAKLLSNLEGQKLSLRKKLGQIKQINKRFEISDQIREIEKEIKLIKGDSNDNRTI